MNKQKRHSVRLIFGLMAIIAAGLVFVKQDDIADQYALWSFTPEPQMAAIIERLELTPKGKAIMYRARPQIDSKSQFNIDCETQPLELELGCYYRGRIYILQIDNPQLQPEMTVVAAHELLHAAWVELSPKQRLQLGDILAQDYAKLADKELRERMADYAVSEPGEEKNELHSILATEYSEVSPVLDTHYGAYFTSRAIAVNDHLAYVAVFSERRNQLESDLALIRSQKVQLSALNQRMDAFKASGKIAQYNALVAAQNQLVDDINRQIVVYEKSVKEYNILSKSLDSQPLAETETIAE